MTKRNGFVLFAAVVWLSFVSVGLGSLYAKDKKLLPEEVLAKHLESIGKPEALAAIKSRTAYGITRVQRPLGTVPLILPELGKQSDPSNFLIASAENRLGMIMKFYDQDYPAEHFAFDGQDTTVSIIARNKKSILGDFVDSYNGMMREGLFGGTLSTAWPLLDAQDRKFKLQYELKEDSSIKLHQLTYTPKSRRHLDNIVINLFFNFETYRHVMTEYKLMGIVNPTSFVIEKFGNFKTIDGLMLPHSYSIEYNTWRGLNPTRWSVEIRQILHNGPVDPQLFHVQ
jgi:hypothetical protein